MLVPDDDDGALVELSGTVSAVSDDDGTRVATIAITATVDGRTVLGRATAEVAVHPGG